MQTLSALEAKAFDTALARHMQQQDFAEQMSEWIDARAAELRQAHGPLRAAHIGEALDSIYGKDVETLFQSPLKSDQERLALADAVQDAVEAYWNDYFNHQAERDYYCRPCPF